MRTSDCSSDVCSSDLGEYYRTGGRCRHPCVSAARAVFPWRRRDRRSSQNESFFGRCKCATEPEVGRASCRESVFLDASISVVAVSCTKQLRLPTTSRETHTTH